MRSIFTTLEVAKRALMAQRTALDVTAHNIANANTVGYSRQKAVFQTTNPYSVAQMNSSQTAGQVGTGVDIEGISRIRDQFLDFQYRAESKREGYWQEIDSQLSRIETIFNEPSEYSIRESMDAFFNSWSELVRDPSSTAIRSTVRQAGKALAQIFTHTNTLLTQTQTNIKDAISRRVYEVNSYLKQLCEVNKSINSSIISGHVPSDLSDQRDLLIDNISELVGIEATTHVDANGFPKLTLTLAGQPDMMLVDDTQYNEIYLDGAQGEYYLYRKNRDLGATMPGDVSSKIDEINDLCKRLEAVYAGTSSEDEVTLEGLLGGINGITVDAANNKVTIDTVPAATTLVDGSSRQGLVYNNELNSYVLYSPEEISSSIEGRIGGLFAAEESVAGSEGNGYKDVLDTLAKGLVDAINFQHKQGYTMEAGNPSGQDLFVFDANSDSYMQFSSIYEGQDGLKKFAASHAPDPVPAGYTWPTNGDNASNIFKLKDQLSGDFDFASMDPNNDPVWLENYLKDTSFYDRYNALIATLGVDTQEARRMVVNQGLLVDQIDQGRQSVSGVSLDEEMTNMVRYQHAYSAAARIMTVFDEMLDTIVNRMGLTGR